jgi:inhibitor of KinA sporulation pathway (predicted exonuclease)
MKHEPVQIFTSLDLEMNQPSGKIIQVGAVVGNMETGEILERLSIFVNPEEELNPAIIALTKIKQEQVDSAGTLEEAYRLLKVMHEKHKSFVNSVVWGGGDSLELLQQLRKENPNFQGWCFGRRWIDTKTLYISWRISQKKPPAGGLSRAMKNVGMSYFCKKRSDIAALQSTALFHSYTLYTSTY